MTPARAVQINELLTTCWIVRAGLLRLPAPSLVGVTLEEAQEATRYIMSIKPRAQAYGGKHVDGKVSTFDTYVALDELPQPSSRAGIK